MTLSNMAIFVVTILSAAVVYLGTRFISRLSRSFQLGCFGTVTAVYVLLLITQPRLWVLSDIIVLLVSVVAGGVLGSLLISKGSIYVFCTTASVADIVSFTGGITAKLIDSYSDGSSNLLAYLCISLPTESGLLPVVGIGDLVILGSLYYALERHTDFTEWWLFAAPTSGLILALVVGLLAGGVWGIPLISLTTVAFLIVQSARSRRAPN